MATTTKTVLGNIVTAVTNNIAKIKEAIGNATTSAAGLMSSTDKTKLDGVETSANKTTIVNNLTTTTTGSALDAAQGKALSDKLASFQAGVDTLYNTGVSLGVTPTAKTPSAIHTAIYDGFQNSVYNKCVSLGTTPSAKTYSSVAEAIDAIASSGSGSSEQEYIICPSHLEGVMGNPTVDGSSVSSAPYNAFYTNIKLTKLAPMGGVDQGYGGVWMPYTDLAFSKKGWAFDNVLYNITGVAGGGCTVQYPNEKNVKTIIYNYSDPSHDSEISFPFDIEMMSTEDVSVVKFAILGSITTNEFNNGKTRIFVMGIRFKFKTRAGDIYSAGITNSEYSIVQTL